MTDLQPYKNKLMELSYEDKMKMSEWLHTQIDLDRGEAIKEKVEKVGGQMSSFLDKAAALTNKSTSNLMDSFKKATSQDNNTSDK